MASDYAWIIDKDHLSGPGGEFFREGEGHDEGLVGPSDSKGGDEVAKDELMKLYQHHHQFRMYDDDGELYYTGTLFWDGDKDSPEEHQAYGPLGDYGMPGAGAVGIRYTGRKEWDCG